MNFDFSRETLKKFQQDRKERLKKAANYVKGKFINALPEKTDTLLILKKYIKEKADNREPRTPIPTVRRTKQDFAHFPASNLRVTWLGHSSMIVEIDGARFLTDPVWGERVSPFTFMGPKRFFAPPLPLSELPHLDAIVLSHDHYDHLDKPTIDILKELNVPFVAPLGVGLRLIEWGIAPEKVVEFNWWESITIAGVELICTPSRHFSGRTLLDRNTTLWASWVFRSANHRVFFSGDTGMFPGFKEIGDKYGPFDVTMIEIGAYDAAWADVHLGPEQAIQAHKALRGKLLLPIHWATFNLGLHAWTEPVERLLIGAAKENIQFVLPKPGESFEPSVPFANTRWWPDLPWKTASDMPVISSGLTD